MSQPKQRKKDVDVLNPLMPSQFLKNIFQLYQKLHDYDVRLSEKIYTYANQYTIVRIASKVIGWISDGPALPFFLFLYGYTNQRAPLTFMAYALFFLLFHEYTLKRIFQRHRPPTAGGKTGFSFPSSHAYASGFVTAICIFTPLPARWLIIFFAGINAANRPVLGVHYITDVIVGAFIGALCGFSWYFVMMGSPLLP